MIFFVFGIAGSVLGQTPILQSLPVCGNSNSVYGSLVFSTVACYTGKGETVSLNLTGTQTLVIKSGASITFSSIYIATGAKLFIEPGATANVNSAYSLDGTIVNYGSLLQSNMSNEVTALTINTGANLYNENTMSVGGSIYLLGTSFVLVNGGNMTIGYSNYNPTITNALSPLIDLCHGGCTYTGIWTLRPGSILNIIGSGISDVSTSSGAIGSSGGCVTNPVGGLFQYGSGDVSGNSCTNKARINFHGTTQTMNFMAPGYGSTNYVVNNSSIILVGAGITNVTAPLGCSAGSYVGPSTLTANSGGIDPRLYVLTSNQQSPLPSVPYSYVDFCQGGVSQLAANGVTGITSLTWYTALSGNAGKTTTAPIPVTANGTAPITYYVSQTVNGCEGPRVPIYVTVSSNIASPASISVSSPSSVCEGGSLALTGPAGYTYSWTGPALYTNTTQSPTVSNNVTSEMGGVYTLMATQGAGATACNMSANTVVSIASRPVISQVPSTGLIGYYKLNGTAVDELKNNQGSMQGSPVSTTNRFSFANEALSFNGSSQFISTSVSYNNPSNLTISLWFKTTTTAGGKLIGFGSSQMGGSSQYDRHIYMNNNGQLYFGVSYFTNVTINSSASYNDGNWHHVAASLSSTNGIKLYVDGTLESTNSATSGGNYSGYWIIGYDNISGWNNAPTSSFFNGSIDDVIIYNKELSASEITTLYNSPDGVSSNSPVCENGTLNLNLISSVFGASYSWSGPSGFSSSSQNTNVANMSKSKKGVYTLTVTAGGCANTASVIANINDNLGPNLSTSLPSNLLHAYKLNNNGYDAIGTSNGMLVNNPTDTINRFGVSNKAYFFNGTNQYMGTSHRENSLNNFTISLWFKTTTATGGKLIGFGDRSVGASGFSDRHIYMNNAGKIYFGVFNSGLVAINSATSYNDGNWHLVSASLSSSNGMKLFIDGVLVASNPAITSAQSYTGFWRIAYDDFSGWPSNPTSRFFKGFIDDVMIYDKELTPGEISTIYKTPDGVNYTEPACTGNDLNLFSTSIASASYAWTGPNGFTSSSQNPVINNLTSSNAGIYSLAVTLNGCTTSASTQVTILTSPSKPSGADSQRCDPGSLTLAASGSQPTYVWYDVNGPLAGGSSTYTTPSLNTTTDYFVSVKDAQGCESSKLNIKAIINSYPAKPIAKDTARCEAGTITISASGSNGSYKWYTVPGGGASFANTASISPSITSTTTYYITSVENSCESLQRTSLKVTVDLTPSAPTPVNGQRCGTGSVDLSANGSSGSYNWYDISTGGSALDNTTTFSTPSISNTTTYYVTAVSGVCESSPRTQATATITGIASPSTSDVTSCPGPITLTANGSPAGYNWYSVPSGGTPIGSGASITISNVTSNNSYYVTSANGSCESNRIPVQVTITSGSIAGTLSSTSSHVCIDANSGIIDLSGESGSVKGWISSNDNFNSNVNTISSFSSPFAFNNITTPTYYKAIVQNGTCNSDTTESLLISVDPIAVGGTVSDNLISPKQLLLTLSGNTGNIIRWEYSEDSTFNSYTVVNETSRELTVELNSLRYYRAVVQSGVCELKYSRANRFMIFKAISPNGDGLNDIWVIEGIERYPDNSVIIFNRYGDVVYEQEGYNNADKVWDGRTNRHLAIGENGELADGTYFYHLRVGSNELKTGFLLLRR